MPVETARQEQSCAGLQLRCPMVRRTHAHGREITKIGATTVAKLKLLNPAAGPASLSTHRHCSRVFVSVFMSMLASEPEFCFCRADATELPRREAALLRFQEFAFRAALTHHVSGIPVLHLSERWSMQQPAQVLTVGHPADRRTVAKHYTPQQRHRRGERCGYGSQRHRLSGFTV